MMYNILKTIYKSHLQCRGHHNEVTLILNTGKEYKGWIFDLNRNYLLFDNSSSARYYNNYDYGFKTQYVFAISAIAGIERK